MVDRSLIGQRSEPVTFEVERGAIRRFAEAIGDPCPAFQRGEIAPPTFPTTFRVPVPGLEAIDPARFLHGEEEYEYVRPIRAGERVTVVREVVDVYEKQGRLGRMTFVVSQVEGRDADTGELVYRGRTITIVR